MQKNTEHIPNRDDVSAAILQHLDGLRGIDTHCHHLPDDQFQNMGVKFLYDHSYCNWMDTYPDDAQEVPEFLLQNSGNSYFYWLRCAISDLYNLPVNAANLNELDRTISFAFWRNSADMIGFCWTIIPIPVRWKVLESCLCQCFAAICLLFVTVNRE